MIKFNSHDLFSKLLTSVTAIAFVFLTAASISAQAEFFDNAFANAAKPPPIGGGGWVITAKVYIKAANGEYITAVGPVKLAADKTLGGQLPMSSNGSAVANNTIEVHIRKSNPAVVLVTRNIAGKPFLGKPTTMVSLPVDENFNYLNGPIDWHGGKGSIQIFLESEFVKKQAAPPAGPIGARYQVGGFMRVSNSEDGIGDYEVEIYGILRVRRHLPNGKPTNVTTLLLQVVEQDASNGFKMDFNSNVFIDVYKDDNMPNFTIDGGFQDRDRLEGLTGDDPMFNSSTCFTRSMSFERAAARTLEEGSILCKGDQDSESADIRYWVKKVSDLHKKP